MYDVALTNSAIRNKVEEFERSLVAVSVPPAYALVHAAATALNVPERMGMALAVKGDGNPLGSDSVAGFIHSLHLTHCQHHYHGLSCMVSERQQPDVPRPSPRNLTCPRRPRPRHAENVKADDAADATAQGSEPHKSTGCRFGYIQYHGGSREDDGLAAFHVRPVPSDVTTVEAIGRNRDELHCCPVCGCGEQGLGSVLITALDKLNADQIVNLEGGLRHGHVPGVIVHQRCRPKIPIPNTLLPDGATWPHGHNLDRHVHDLTGEALDTLYETVRHDVLEALTQIEDSRGGAGPDAAKLRQALDDADEAAKKVVVRMVLRAFCTNGRVVGVNPHILRAFRSNCDCQVIRGLAGKNIAFYILKYLTKETTDPTTILSTIVQVRKDIAEHPSEAADSGTPERDYLHFCQRMANKQVSGSAAAPRERRSGGAED